MIIDYPLHTSKCDTDAMWHYSVSFQAKHSDCHNYGFSKDVNKNPDPADLNVFQRCLVFS